MIGEIYMDYVDLAPEIFLSRAPVKNSSQVEAFVRKTLAYERDPAFTPATGHLLSVGVKSWNFWDGKSDNHHRMDHLYNRYISRYWKGEKVNFFDSGTDFPEGSDYHVTSGNLSAQLNQGFSVFNFAGHGNNINFVMESGPGFSSHDAGKLSNEAMGLMLTNACDVSAFDSIDPCLGEALLRNPEGGCVAFFGSARYGFGNPEKTSYLGSSLQYNATFLEKLFSDDPECRWNTFGGLTAMTKTTFTNNGSAGGTLLYLLYAINPLGDPEMQIYAGIPSIFDRVRIFRVGNSLLVNAGSV